MITLETAQSLFDSGLCVLPAHKDEKRPTVSWQKYQKTLPSQRELESLFPAPRCCVVCGAVSGNLEILDFDSKGVAFEPFLKRIPPQLARKLLVEQTPSGGFHIIYRCEQQVGKNQKLALNNDGKVLVETRGEGGLFLCAPSDGYTMMQGSWENIPVLSEVERTDLLDAAKECGVDFKLGVRSEELGVNIPDPNNHSSLLTPNSSTASPAEDFNARGDLRAMLQEAGWTLFATKSDGEEWTRPGKTTGCSATLRKCDGVEIFYVFSSSVPEFEPGKGYNAFQVYACLKCGGDMSLAARELLKLGYGAEEAPDYDYLLKSEELEVRSEELEDDYYDDKSEMDEENSSLLTPNYSLPESLFEIPGFMGLVYRDIFNTMPKKQPEYALCAALCAQSLLCHQKYSSPQGFRANIYCMVSGSSGSGKDWGRKYLKELFRLLAMTENVRESYQSFPAIQNDLRYEYSPKLILWDEFGKAIQMMNLKNSAPYTREIIPGLMKLYTSADSTFYPSIKSDVKGSKKERADYDPIENPFVSLLGTATPDQLLGNLSMDMVSEGFLGRAFLFEEREVSDFRPTIRRKAMTISDSVLAEAGYQKNSPSEEWDPDNEKATSDGSKPPQTREVEMTVEGEAELQRLLDFQTDQIEASESGILWARAEEQAEKLALLYAVSAYPEAPVIDQAAAQWGCALSECLTRKRIQLAEAWVAISDFNAKQKEVLRYMKGRGAVTQSQLCKRFWAWTPKERDDVFNSLKSSGKIRSEEKEGKTKKTTVWKAK